MPATKKRPLTQRELKKIRKAKEADGERMTVYNPTKRMIPIQVRDVGRDFFVSEQSIYVGPGKRYTDKRSRFNMDQIANLQAKGEIKIIGDRKK